MCCIKMIFRSPTFFQHLTPGLKATPAGTSSKLALFRGIFIAAIIQHRKKGSQFTWKYKLVEFLGFWTEISGQEGGKKKPNLLHIQKNPERK